MIYTTDLDTLEIWNGSAWRILSLGTPTNGSVLQVQYGSTTTQVANAGTSYTDTGATVTITPKSTSSKVLVIASTAIYTASGDCNVYTQLLRDSTSLGINILNDSGDANGHGISCITVLDSPSTTSATTYKTQFKNNVSSRTSYVCNASTICSVTAMEIAG
jgi:hypothetical protein